MYARKLKTRKTIKYNPNNNSRYHGIVQKILSFPEIEEMGEIQSELPLVFSSHRSLEIFY